MMIFPSIARAGLVLMVLALAVAAQEQPQGATAEAEKAAALERAKQLEESAVRLFREGKYGEAAPLAREAIDLREKALGPDHPDVAQILNTLAEILRAQGQHEAARPLYERALAIDERALGPEHPDVGGIVNNLAELARVQGQYDVARPLYERALAIEEKTLGPDHPEVATTVNNIALLLHSQGQYEAARPFYERAIAIYEKALGPEHPNVAATLNNLAALCWAQGRYDAARPLLERALAIREKALGPDHPDVATSLNTLAVLLDDQGQYAAARPLYERALAIREKALGPDHPDVATILNNLASFLQAQGQYAAARPLYERALAIYERALGREHVRVGLALNNLASFLQAQGQYEAARPLYERALAIREKALGRDHPAVAATLNGLALLLTDQGQYDAARPLHERALAIDEKALGPEHQAVAVDLNNLALLLEAQRQYEAARPLFERALAIDEKALGPQHPEVATNLDNLALLLKAQGKCGAARPLCERALAIREMALGPDHLDVATSLNNLALILEAQGQYEAARPLYERALAIEEQALGPENPLVVPTLNNLAAILDHQGRYKAALGYSQRALRITEARVRQGCAGLQGSERLRLSQFQRKYLDDWLARAPRVGRTGYPEVFQLRGLVTRAEAAERALLRSGGEEACTSRDEILAFDRRLARSATRIPREAEAREAWRKSYAELAAKREALALEMARRYAPLRQALERLDLTVADAQARLGEDQVLVDLLRSRDRYLAWIVTRKGEPVRVDLGEAAAIDPAAQAFADAAAHDRDWSRTGERLAALVLAPLRPLLPGGTKRLYVCPDAALAAVPFAALPGAKPGTFLLDEFEIVHIEMAQDLVPPVTPQDAGAGALVIGGVDYDRAEAAKDLPSPLLLRVDRAPRGSGKWDPLPATAHEVDMLQRRLGERATILTGAGANEAQFSALAKGKGLLHLATHGYVREDRLAGLVHREEDARRLDPMLERQVAVGSDPMLLSGVVLAGANGEGAEGDDGLLTAAEVSWLDLEACDLVVLSACDTGRGTVAAGEGTLGLVRGFRLAGARRVVASLWKVDDEATGLFMERFYAGLLDRKLEPVQALREAALGLRDCKDAGGKQAFAAPRYWAAFVAYGR